MHHMYIRSKVCTSPCDATRQSTVAAFAFSSTYAPRAHDGVAYAEAVVPSYVSAALGLHRRVLETQEKMRVLRERRRLQREGVVALEVELVAQGLQGSGRGGKEYGGAVRGCTMARSRRR